MLNDLTDIEYVRAALANAFFSGLSLEDVMEASMWAVDAEAFDDAVNLMTLAVLPFDVE